jgi:2-dehydro-3-deoxyphosphogluconate aldolase / (4S)-4-hydroxy-2-oxoglutarate aldolase
MEKYQVIQTIRETGIVAIVRGTRPEEAISIANALYDGGIRAIEITCNTKGYLGMIEALSAAVGDKMCVGAGTVLSTTAAQLVIDAGAQFVLAPNLDEGVVKIVHQCGKLMIPGVATPTEILQAAGLGVDVVKLFPAGSLGHKYLKDIRGPIQHVAIMPVGGINLGNVGEFVKSGAFAFGIGGELVDKTAIEAKNYGVLTEKARAFVNAFQQARA